MEEKEGRMQVKSRRKEGDETGTKKQNNPFLDNLTKKERKVERNGQPWTGIERRIGGRRRKDTGRERKWLRLWMEGREVCHTWRDFL